MFMKELLRTFQKCFKEVFSNLYCPKQGYCLTKLCIKGDGQKVLKISLTKEVFRNVRFYFS